MYVRQYKPRNHECYSHKSNFFEKHENMFCRGITRGQWRALNHRRRQEMSFGCSESFTHIGATDDLCVCALDCVVGVHQLTSKRGITIAMVQRGRNPA